MIQYRLIKKYPGSEKLGNIEWFNRDVLGKNGCSNDWKGRVFYDSHPEFWQKVEELDYQILSFVSTHDLSNNKPSKLLDNGNHTWTSDSSPGETCEEDLLNGKYAIHSVKRLSDGEVFTIGDTIEYVGIKVKISNIYISEKRHLEDGVWLINKNGGACFLSVARKLKTPLFTTEDGVDIFKGDYFFVVETKFDKYRLYETLGGHFTKEKSTRLRFSSKEKAEKYVLYNKPCLSINEIGSNIPEGTLSRLLDKVKSKL